MKYLRYLAIWIFTFAVGVGISPTRFYGESITCGPRGSSAVYRSSFGNFDYDSEAEASEAFHERLMKAIHVADIAPKVNKNEVLIEQRMVALFFDERTNQYYAAAVWIEGRVMHSIHSTSFKHVMELEKQNF
jgi:hypothetical protein